MELLSDRVGVWTEVNRPLHRATISWLFRFFDLRRKIIRLPFYVQRYHLLVQ